MAIQECDYFNGVGIHWGSIQFFQKIFSLSDLVLTINFCYSQLINCSWYFFVSYLKKTQK